MNLLADSSVSALWAGVITSSLIGMAAIVASAWTAWILAKAQRSQTERDIAREEDRKRQQDERESAAREVAEVKRRLAQADEKQHVLTEKLIDERVRAVSHEFRNHVNEAVLSVDGLKAAVDDIKKRLERGDGELSALQSMDHAIELKVVAQLGQVKDWFRDLIEKLATRSELELVERETRSLATQVAVLNAGGRKSS